jgi:hypothetical protein
MLNSAAAKGKEVILELPSSNVWGITGATNVRCILTWRAANKLYEVMADASVATGTPDKVTWLTPVGLV